MNKTASRNLCYPPLTPDDIFTLRGTPMAKRVEPLKNSFSGGGGFPPDGQAGVYGGNPAIEEWVYYNVKEKIKEVYLFKNSKLMNYQTKEAV